MNHVIPLKQAIEMTKRFREQSGSGAKMNIPRSETFDRSIFDQVLSQNGCVKVRIYSGLDDQMGFRAIIVGVNDKDHDMLPVPTPTADSIDNGSTIGEDGMTCPPYCPPPSELNP